MELVMQQRSAFRNGLKDKRFDKTAKFDANNLHLFKVAVLLGYGDAKRTFSKIGEFWNNKQIQRDAFFETIAKKLQLLFTNNASDTWHEDLCENFCSELAQLGYNNVTYGQAQKVINMALKYLFCFDGAEKYKTVFDKCHMPLDSYTLSWYRKLPKPVDKNARIYYDTKWSNLTKEKYIAIQDHIRDRLKNDSKIKIDDQEILLPNQPLYAEFIIWPEEILLMAGNSFMKALNPDHKNIDSDSMCLLKHILYQQLPKYCKLDVSITEKK